MDKTYIRYKCIIYKKAFQEVKKEVQDIIFFKHKKSIKKRKIQFT